MPDDTPNLQDFLAYLDAPVEPATPVGDDFRAEPTPRRPTYTGSSPTIRAIFAQLHAANDQCTFSDNEAAAGKTPSRSRHGVAQQNAPATALPLSPTPKPSQSTPSIPSARPLPAYRSLTEDQKLDATLDAFDALQAYAFRLTFSPKKDAKLRSDAAAGRDILQQIADSIVDAFRRRGLGVPAILFGLEEQPGQRLLHIHGVALPAEGIIDHDLFRAILKSACGGDVYGGHASGHGVWIKGGPITTGRRYLAYARKHESIVMRRLGLKRVVFMNNAARKLGREHHTAQRAVATPRKRASTLPAVSDSAESEARQRPSMAVSGGIQNAVNPTRARIQKNSVRATLIQATDQLSRCYMSANFNSQLSLTTCHNLSIKRILTIDITAGLNHETYMPLICGGTGFEGNIVDTEIYIENGLYDLLADTLRLALKHSIDKPLHERRDEFRVLVSTLDTFPDAVTGDAGRADRPALIDALATYTPVIGEPDVRDVRWLLGDLGNLFPARVRAMNTGTAIAA